MTKTHTLTLKIYKINLSTVTSKEYIPRGFLIPE